MRTERFGTGPNISSSGSLRDAILHLAGANATHGLRRSNADKRRAVLLLLDDEEWAQWTSNQIANACRVSWDLVEAVRGTLTSGTGSEGRPASPPPAPEAVIVKARAIEEEGGCPRFYNDRYGNVSVMRTGAIGRRAADAPVDPAPSADEPASAEPSAEQTNVASALRRTPERSHERRQEPAGPAKGDHPCASNDIDFNKSVDNSILWTFCPSDFGVHLRRVGVEMRLQP